jgi:hypothetical protein
MHSRVRPVLEAALRSLSLVVLSLLVLRTFRPAESTANANAVGQSIDASLVQWSTRERPERVHITFAAPPGERTRDWLAALAHSGTSVTWDGRAPAASALSIEPVPDPQRTTSAWLSAPAGTHGVLRDRLGVVDSVKSAQTGLRVVAPKFNGMVRAEFPEFAATSALRDSLVLRRVLVVGEAGWESKFTIAALEERGWKVDVRLAVAPTGDVLQGDARLVIDTGRYSAVVVLDSVAARYNSQMIRYVQAGGGLIATGEAAALLPLAPILPAVVTEEPSLPGVFTTQRARASPRSALALAPLRRIKRSAVVLETRETELAQTAVAAVAWRVGNGRVLQIGYRDTWRWRLSGADEDPVRAHRAWWATLVSSVAFAPRIPLARENGLEPTPLASLVGTLGPPAKSIELRVRLFDDPRFVPFVFSVLLAALLIEWLSRRLRGKA